MPRRVQHPSGSLQYARGSLCGRRGTSAAARDLVREMGQPRAPPIDKSTDQAGRGGLIHSKQSQILPHVENPSGISTNAAPSRKPKQYRQNHGAQHCIFAPFSRRAPTHPPCPPGSPRGAAPRQSDCARRRNGPRAPREKTACRSKKIPAQTAPRPPGGAWGSPRPAPRARRAPDARLKGRPN